MYLSLNQALELMCSRNKKKSPSVNQLKRQILSLTIISMSTFSKDVMGKTHKEHISV